MVPEVEVFQHVYHIVGSVRLQVLLPQVFQDLHLDECLVMESLFVPARTKASRVVIRTKRTKRSI